MGERAVRLAEEIKRDTLTGIPRALADEAVLIVERLEHLDAVLQGDPAAWLQVLDRMPPGYAEVVINAPLAEARQQATALKGLLAELSKALGQALAVPAASATDEVKQKREDRRRAAGLL